MKAEPGWHGAGECVPEQRESKSKAEGSRNPDWDRDWRRQMYGDRDWRNVCLFGLFKDGPDGERG